MKNKTNDKIYDSIYSIWDLFRELIKDESPYSVGRLMWNSIVKPTMNTYNCIKGQLKEDLKEVPK